MPEVAMVKKPKPEVMAISALVALGGLGIVILSLRPGTKPGHGDLKLVAPGEWMSWPIAPNLEAPGVIPVRIGQAVQALRPTVLYQGPGRDTGAYFRIVQKQGTDEVTVQGSGVAGVHVGPATEPTMYDLVAPTEPQPTGCPSQALCAYPWGASQLPPYYICGAPPQPGYADVLLEIYQREVASDPLSLFCSPTCGCADTQQPRRPVMAKRYPSKILFSA